MALLAEEALLLRDVRGRVLRDSRGRQPRVTTLRRGGQTWIAIGGDLARLPEDILLLRGIPEASFSQLPTRITHWHPAPWNPTFSYRAYTPDVYQEAKEMSLSWFFTASEDLRREVESGEIILDELRSWIDHDITDAYQLIHDLSQHVPAWRQPAGLLPQEEVKGRISLPGSDHPNFCQAVAESQHLFLEAVAVSNQLLCHFPVSTHASLFERIPDGGKFQQATFIGEANKLGCVLDIQTDDLPRFPLWEFVRHDVPIYYVWEEGYEEASVLSDLFDPEHLRCIPVTEETMEVDNPKILILAQLSTELQITLKNSRVLPRQAAKPSLLERLADEETVKVAEIQPPLGELFSRVVTTMGWTSGGWRVCLEEDAKDGPGVFNSLVWDVARLCLPPASELALRVCMNQYAEADGETVITEAVRRCVPFQLIYPVSQLSRFRPVDSLFPAELPEHLEFSFADAALVFDERPAACYKEYMLRVKEVLRRDNAVALLFQGGLVARLAIHFGGSDLLRRFLQGPSSALYNHFYGSAMLMPDHLLELAGTSEDVLLGRTKDRRGVDARAWWPPIRIWEIELGFNGQWLQVHEEWFQNRLVYNKTNRATLEPLSTAQWARKLKDWRNGFGGASAELVSTIQFPSVGGATISNLAREVFQECGASWNRSSVKEIVV